VAINPVLPVIRVCISVATCSVCGHWSAFQFTLGQPVLKALAFTARTGFQQTVALLCTQCRKNIKMRSELLQNLQVVHT